MSDNDLAAILGQMQLETIELRQRVEALEAGEHWHDPEGRLLVKRKPVSVPGVASGGDPK